MKATARAASLLVALTALWTAPAPAWAATGHPAVQKCGDVVVKFEPEGSGGAHAIRATELGCVKARKLAKSCINGTVPEGWTVVTWRRTLMTKGSKRVSYLPVGGGGCGAFPQSCDDFGYRGVGFFNMQVLGVRCRKGRKIARTWYDSAGACGFGEKCDVGKYVCTGYAKTGTVVCRRPNGYRVTWQMGE